MHIQEALIYKLSLETLVDDWISSSEVEAGRPEPYMIEALMRIFDLNDASKVAKIGDSCLDVKEGKNAQLGLVIGVESGADNKEKLYDAGADLVLTDICETCKCLKS